MSQVKTGAEIVKDFFESLPSNEELAQDVVAVLIKLNDQTKATSTNILNELETLRKKALSDEA